jgi:hypothetical protein
MAAKRILLVVLLASILVMAQPLFAQDAVVVRSLEGTMSQLASAAKQLDSATSSGGPTAAQNQKIQELTFNLADLQTAIANS